VAVCGSIEPVAVSKSNAVLGVYAVPLKVNVVTGV